MIPIYILKTIVGILIGMIIYHIFVIIKLRKENKKWK